MRDEVGDEFLVMIADRVVGLDGHEEIARDEFRALVNELIEGVLAVGARFSPDDLPSGVIDAISFAIDAFSVAFHIALLEVGGETTHILVVW